jgi:tetratricopeptide (TPR) repeat protein
MTLNKPRPTGLDRCQRLYELGWQQVEQGQYEAALQTFQDLLVVSDRWQHGGLQQAAHHALQELGVEPVTTATVRIGALTSNGSSDTDPCEQRCAQGDSWVDQQHLAAALVAYQEALQGATAAENTWQIGQCLNRIGRVYQLQQAYDRAATYFRSAAHILVAESPAATAVAYHNEGLCYYAQQRYEAALECFKAALDHWQGVEDTLGVALTLDYLGRVYAHQQDYWLALGSFEAALDVLRGLSRQQDVRVEAADLLVQIAHLCEQTCHWDLAIVYWLDALTIAPAPNPAMQATVLSQAGQLHHRLGQTAIARHYYQWVIALAR